MNMLRFWLPKPVTWKTVQFAIKNITHCKYYKNKIGKQNFKNHLYPAPDRPHFGVSASEEPDFLYNSTRLGKTETSDLGAQIPAIHQM